MGAVNQKVKQSSCTFLGADAGTPHKEVLIESYKAYSQGDDDTFDLLKELVRKDESIQQFHSENPTIQWPVSEKGLLSADGYFNSLTE